MKDSLPTKSFIFNQQIDADSLYALYGEDYQYIAEIFATVLLDYDSLCANILASHAAGNLAALKAAVHKIKPVFGFVGITTLQSRCQSFENSCQDATSIADVSAEFSSLINNLTESKSLLESEEQKLASFNN